MDQSRALNALAPFIALAKSATSPRAAADLITQATSAPNTYVFAELLQQPNIQALAGHEQYGNSHELLKIFAWGTWESYKASPNLPPLSDTQTTKLRLLTLLTLAAEKTPSSSTHSNLSYTTLLHRLDLDSTIDLEHLVTEAIYSNLLTATLNPAAQTIVITSVAPLRDLAPGSVREMIAELEAWSGRCEGVLAELEAEMERVRKEAGKRAAREAKAERQVRGVMEAGEKAGSGGVIGGGSGLGLGRGGHSTRGSLRRAEDVGEEDEDAMEVDGGLAGGGRKRSSGAGSAFGSLMGKMGRNGR